MQAVQRLWPYQAVPIFGMILIKHSAMPDPKQSLWPACRLVSQASTTIMCVQAFQASMQAALKPDELEEFAIRGQEVEVDEAAGKGAPAAGMLVSVKASGAAPDGEKEPKKAAEASSLYKKMQGKRKGGKGSKVVSGKRPKR